ncbi:MAG: hypothetical protein LBI56_03580 [Puniceicoccales bacterium]|jgi:hypothetical protein|nr:hypothetical protein [Puniceicoccales bacterium]
MDVSGKKVFDENDFNENINVNGIRDRNIQNNNDNRLGVSENNGPKSELISNREANIDNNTSIYREDSEDNEGSDYSEDDEDSDYSDDDEDDDYIDDDEGSDYIEDDDSIDREDIEDNEGSDYIEDDEGSDYIEDNNNNRNNNQPFFSNNSSSSSSSNYNNNNIVPGNYIGSSNNHPFFSNNQSFYSNNNSSSSSSSSSNYDNNNNIGSGNNNIVPGNNFSSSSGRNRRNRRRNRNNSISKNAGNNNSNNPTNVKAPAELRNRKLRNRNQDKRKKSPFSKNVQDELNRIIKEKPGFISRNKWRIAGITATGILGVMGIKFLWGWVRNFLRGRDVAGAIIAHADASNTREAENLAGTIDRLARFNENNSSAESRNLDSQNLGSNRPKGISIDAQKISEAKDIILKCANPQNSFCVQIDNGFTSDASDQEKNDAFFGCARASGVIINDQVQCKTNNDK